ncbi:MAG: shikimate kinase [Bacillota bacterium]
MKVSLVGFMGTGKSTVGSLLAEELNLPFLETDTLIEKELGQSIDQIFNQKGEVFFRKQETEILKKIIINKKDFVLSTGGGIVIKPENRNLLKANTSVILLKASPETIYNRVKNNTERPLLNIDNPLMKIKKLLKKRENYYNQFTPQIDTDNKSPKQIVHQIKLIIGVD